MDNSFNVMDMVDEYAAANDIAADEIFKKDTPAPEVKEETKAPVVSEEKAPDKKAVWTPDAELIADMPELQNSNVGVEVDPDTYNKIPEIVNGADESVKSNGNNEIEEMRYKLDNIEAAKKRHGIKNLQIPRGQLWVDIMLAASNPDINVANAKLDELFETIKTTYPQFILDREVASNDATFTYENTKGGGENVSPAASVDNSSVPTSEDEVKIVIDKRNVPEISWTEEEIQKIRKARTVELNIVDSKQIHFGDIVDVDDNAVDRVLSQFKRKTNDVTGVLPASKYRATFSGLSYPESIDLITAGELNNYDSNMKMWTIAFNHIHNQSIGPWEEYYEYNDPVTNRLTKMSANGKLPEGVDADQVKFISKFQDFMRKTSYLDLEFIIWKILCASSMDSEIIRITCRNTKENGQLCNAQYDWIYKPSSLLDINSINPAVLEDMREAGEASTYDSIMEAYNSSAVNGNHFVELPSCGLYVAYGHADADSYMNPIFGLIEANEKEAAEENATDPSIVTRAMVYNALPVIKAFIINNNGKYERIVGVQNFIKILQELDEVDWGVISELYNMMTKPYQFEFVMKDLVCPECHNKSSIHLDSLSRLLFTHAQTLRSVQVKLTKK